MPTAGAHPIKPARFREGHARQGKPHPCNRHEPTGEAVDIKVRFHGGGENGFLRRIGETHEARFIEAYERFGYGRRASSAPVHAAPRYGFNAAAS
jgi:hypothetical protein